MLKIVHLREGYKNNRQLDIADKTDKHVIQWE